MEKRRASRLLRETRMRDGSLSRENWEDGERLNIAKERLKQR